ncbi:MAG: methyltransferase domain-containing protein [Planctomycetota bacterium]
MGAGLATLKSWLEHPLTRGLDLDDPDTTALRLQIVREKRFLRKIYEEWYAAIAAALPPGDSPVLELGSGAGFLKDYVPGLITSDVFLCPGVDRVVDALDLPFAAGELRGITMLNVFHHVPRVREFLTQATRCVQPGGALVMIEPWITPWSRLVYKHLHHEPIDEQTQTWEFAAGGPLSSANGALPWIVFQRDRAIFEAEFPAWRIDALRPMMPLRYLLSGGISLRSLVPGWSFGFWRGCENALARWMHKLAMFAIIRLVRVDSTSATGGRDALNGNSPGGQAACQA